ncbi:hypothetical protein FB45DRAFT_450136 [Roridomyces roridus]|uniref:Uncharacterized protein n=1 Tax=Roridomyces roridus TaxID=1738132 RepID=A0AAD7FT97_9AGAR|nr:hypothetical protein FB45DRAFT_450136 [Roridomyces roridus]
MSNTAIVDERAMQYSGSWNGGGQFIEFSGTTKWSSAQGSTAKYTFQGTQITVYASVAANSSSASMSFAVDNFTGSYSSTSAGGAALYHAPLWASPPLSDGQHTLVVTQDEAQASGVIFLDYLLYETTSSAPGTVYFVDDRDSRIAYSTPWEPFGSQGDFMHTSSESSDAGDSFIFEFEGTSIEYYGGLNPLDAGKTIGSIVLDGADPVLYTAPSPIPGITNNQIFNATNLGPGTHKLVATSTDVTGRLWADYFLVTPNVDASVDPSPSSGTTTSLSAFTSTGHGSSSSNPSASAHSSSGTSSPLSGQLTIVGGSSTPSAGSTNKPSSRPESNSAPHSLPTAAIAASTVGAGVFLSLLLLAACILIRRRRRRDRGDLSDPLIARPFGLSSTLFESSPRRKSREAAPGPAVADGTRIPTDSDSRSVPPPQYSA